mgnify:CR=1 FL=1
MEHCQLCKKEYETIYKLPCDIWYKITPNIYKEGGLLCLECADKKAREIGFIPFWYAGHLKYPKL